MLNSTKHTILELVCLLDVAKLSSKSAVSSFNTFTRNVSSERGPVKMLSAVRYGYNHVGIFTSDVMSVCLVDCGNKRYFEVGK